MRLLMKPPAVSRPSLGANDMEREWARVWAGQVASIIVAAAVLAVLVIGSYCSSGWTNADDWGIRELAVCVSLAGLLGAVAGFGTYARMRWF